MHRVLFAEFDRVCRTRSAGGRVLEVGSVPTPSSLLNLPALSGASEKVGINLEGASQYRDFKIVAGDANRMDIFADSSFDVVLCNAMLEHDRYFWRTIDEIHRVTRLGGLIVLGVPGYRPLWGEQFVHRAFRAPLLRALGRNATLNSLSTATLTFEVHDAPGDYYRFSEQAVRDVLLGGCRDVDVRSLMLPPRFIGAGVKA